MWQEKMLMVCYELMLLALNAGDWNGFDRLQNDAKRLDRDIRRGKIEARKNDGHTATHGADGKFTGSTPYAGGGGSGGGSDGQGENTDAAAAGDALSESDKRARHLYDKMTKEERTEVIQRGQNEPKAVFSYDRPDNKAMTYLQKVPKEPDTFDVISHGSPDRIEFFRQDYPTGDRRAAIDAYTLSCILKGRSDYKALVADCQQRGVTPTVRLLSCNTGNTTNTGDCFAQLLANELGHYVTAPTDVLYAHQDGSYDIGIHNDGSMKPFYSRK